MGGVIDARLSCPLDPEKKYLSFYILVLFEAAPMDIFRARFEVTSGVEDP